MNLVLEACIETIEEAVRAEVNGAHNVEVCSRLDLDGLTPSIELVEEIAGKTKLGQNVMIRSRGGDFSYNEEEIQIMFSQIERIKSSKIKGFVFGATNIDALGNIILDIETINRIADVCHPYPLTIHKAIDVCSDIMAECRKILICRDNIKFVLTSGGKPTAVEGMDTIRQMHVILSPKINVIAAGKVTKEIVEHLHEYCGFCYFHGRKIV